MTDEVVEKHELCSIETPNRSLCGRPIHPAPEHDPEPVCLMHSRDPMKSEEEFQKEFERILAQTEQENGRADFFGFCFLASDYRGRIFKVACNFTLAAFKRDASFSAAKFTKGANFGWATFTGIATFDWAKFTGGVNFYGAKFTGDASFRGAKFMRYAGFDKATFTGDADFYAAEFPGEASFNEAMFAAIATFDQAKFTGDASFNNAIFTGNTSFGWVMFKADAWIDGARFGGDVTFADATFTGEAIFERAHLPRFASFSNASFLEGARSRETHFRHDATLQRGLCFTDVRLEHPEQIEFYKTDLGQALFLNTDVSKIDFTLVDWRKRKGRYSLFEEVVAHDQVRVRDLAPIAGSGDERNYGLIAETYQQLKRNYDSKGDYWTAGHFHYGEMEMLRLHSRFRWKPMRWLAQNLSLTALYKYGSAYGESMGRPLAWLAAMVLLFALLFPLAGLELNPKQGDVGLAGWQVDYWNARKYFIEHSEENSVPSWVRWVTRDHAAVPLLVHSGMTALSVAGFQKELRYSPAYPWGGRWRCWSCC
jgi:Pentapeptide repeats (9 copies)